MKFQNVSCSTHDIFVKDVYKCSDTFVSNCTYPKACRNAKYLSVNDGAKKRNELASGGRNNSKCSIFKFVRCTSSNRAYRGSYAYPPRWKERAMLVRNSHNPLLFTDLSTPRYFTAGDNMNEQYQRINSFFPIHHSCTSFREHGDDY